MSLIPYDDRDGFIWLDGKIMPWRETKVHFLTHALHYGSSVFEGMRAYNGRIFKLKEHLERMIAGTADMDMKIPYSIEEMSAACIEALKANNITDGYLRPLAWRGAEQMGITARQSKVHFGVAAWVWPKYFSPESRENGITLKTSHWRRPPPECAPVHVKAAGLYMICTLAKHDAENQGFTDALMLDYRGHVAELTGANFFMIKNGELHTPKPDVFLNGITRLTVLDLAAELGIKAHIRTIMPEELADAEECFATGTAAEITPIGRIDHHHYKVGPVTRVIRGAYEKLVNQP